MAQGDVVFLDTETTSLRRPWMDAPKAVWEIGYVVWFGGDRDRRYESKVHLPLPYGALADADPFALRMNGFFDRWKIYPHDDNPSKLQSLAGSLRDATLVGNNISFDEEALGHACHREDIFWSPHYHQIDLYSATIGALMALGEEGLIGAKSEDLSARVGAPPPEDRHDALVDAQWNEQWFLALENYAR